MLVIDDALLLDVLANTAAPELLEARRRGELGTTGSWYWRATRAALGGGHGALLRRIEALSPVAQGAIRAGLDDLPTEITMISLRRLVPIMARLPRPANLLTLEAVAAARLLEAELLVSTTSSLLEDWPRQPGSGSAWQPAADANAVHRVGKAGFEPAASASRTLRATKLRYFPEACSARRTDLSPPLSPGRAGRTGRGRWTR